MNLKRISKVLALAICVIVAVLYLSVHSTTTNLLVDANIVVEGTIPDSKVVQWSGETHSARSDD